MLSFGAIIWLYESGGMHDVVTGYIMYMYLQNKLFSLLTAVSLRHVCMCILDMYTMYLRLMMTS